MTTIFKPIALALLLASAGAVHAQETATEDTAAEETGSEDTGAADGTTNEDGAAPATPGAEDPAADLNMGEPAAVDQSQPISAEELETLQPGMFYTLEVFGDWRIRCIKTPEGEDDPCQLYQLLMDQDGNAVAEVNMFPLPEGSRAAAGANIVAPLETLLTEQLTLTVDGGQARRYPFTFCNAGGCVARVGFTQAEIDQFKRGNSARIRLVPAGAPDQEVLLTMSLTGFTAGIEGTVDLPR